MLVILHKLKLVSVYILIKIFIIHYFHAIEVSVGVVIPNVSMSAVIR